MAKLNEEYGKYKYFPEIEYIADKLDSGNQFGYEPYMFGNWELKAYLDGSDDLFGENSPLTDDMQDYLAYEISYPVRDGHISYSGLDIIVHSGSGVSKEDLLSLDPNHDYFDEKDIDAMLNDDKEIEFWIDYEIDYDEDIEEFEENYKGENKMTKKINEEIDNEKEDFKRQERIYKLAKEAGVKFFADEVEKRGDMLWNVRTVLPAELSKVKRMSVFDYSEMLGGTVDSHRYYNDYVVLLTGAKQEDGDMKESLNEKEVNEEGFTDRVDRDFDISLYEYGVARNPENDMTLIGTKPTDEGVYSDYVVMYISLEDVREVLEDMEDGFFDYIDDTRENVLETLDNNHLAMIIQSIDAYNGYWADQAFYMENYKKQPVKKSRINEGNYEGGDAYYQFCKDIKLVMSEGHDFEEAVYECLDDMVYYSDVINVWTNLPGNLGSRDQEITDLMREDIEEAVMDDREFIEGLDESFKPARKFKRLVNETIFNKYGEPLPDEEWNKREALGMNESKVKDLLKQNKAKEISYGEFVNQGVKKSGQVKTVTEHGSKKVNGTYDEIRLVVYKKGAVQITTFAKNNKTEDKYFVFKEDFLGESLNKKSVNEISIEKAKEATDARKQRMADLGSKYGKEMGRDFRSYRDKRVKPSKLSRDEMIALGDKWHDNERKYLKDRDMLAKKLAKSESLEKTNVMKKIIHESQAVLSMNESECGEMLTWQFTLSEKADKVSFGGNNINCVITNDRDGVAVTNFSMTESQVRNAINEALSDNGIKGKVSKLVNLY